MRHRPLSRNIQRYLSTFVRIQDERGHTTVTVGPYRFVRHPMYVGILLMSLGMPLLLGSWWALLPEVFNIGLFFVQTALEDRTLQAELPGYKDYVQKVHYRLILESGEPWRQGMPEIHPNQAEPSVPARKVSLA